MQQAHLDYFKSLFEGTADVSWNAWFSQHEEELKAELPRAAFLRLKFKKLEEAERSLREAGVAYRLHPAAVKREKHYALLHPSVLDDAGRPLPAFRRKAYQGAFGQLMDGDVAGGAATLREFLKKVRRFPVERRQEELESLCFDGEMELEYGDRTVARALLEAVASFPEGHDLTDFAVRTAKDLLSRKDNEHDGPS